MDNSSAKHTGYLEFKKILAESIKAAGATCVQYIRDDSVGEDVVVAWSNGKRSEERLAMPEYEAYLKDPEGYSFEDRAQVILSGNVAEPEPDPMEM